jgi:glycosyltransferase involved in cell wall biosynthesis
MPERHTRNTVKCFVRPAEIRATDQVIADTRSGLDDLLRVVDHPRENCHVIHLGIDTEVFHPPAADATPADAPYLLSVGTIEPRKNLVRALAAFERLAKDHAGLRWKIAGQRGWGWSEFSSALARSPVRDRVDLLGPVPDADLAGLYRSARALLFPTLWEGFGFPVVEALACGTPAAASKLPAIEEAGGGAFVPLDPTSIESMVEAVERAAFEEAGRASRKAAGLEHAKRFDWARTAEETLRVYAQALDRPVEELLTAS